MDHKLFEGPVAARGARVSARIAGAALLVASTLAAAAPAWRYVGAYDLAGGGEATVWIDSSSAIRSGGRVRVWVMTDFPTFQVGEWTAPTGESKAYMSEKRLVLIDCATKDFGYGPWHAHDGPKATGTVVYSTGVPTPTSTPFPAAPGSIGESIATAACRLNAKK